jgi:hypothetical protein
MHSFLITTQLFATVGKMTPNSKMITIHVEALKNMYKYFIMPQKDLL